MYHGIIKERRKVSYMADMVATFAGESKKNKKKPARKKRPAKTFGRRK